MSNTLKSGVAAILLAAIAFYAGVQYQKRHDDHDYYRTSAVNAAAEAGLCTNALQAITTGRVNVAQKILERTMRDDVTTALDATRKMAKLQVPLPSIVEGMRRTAVYAQAHGMARSAADATQVARNLAAAGGVWADPHP